MKIALGDVKTLEKSRDCFLMAAALTDLTCNLQKAVNAVTGKDGEAAKDFLRGAAVNAQSMKDLYPGRADQAQKILKDVKSIAKDIPDEVDDKGAKIRHRIYDVESQTINLRTGTKVRCDVPLPFQIEARKRKK